MLSLCCMVKCFGIRFRPTYLASRYFDDSILINNQYSMPRPRRKVEAPVYVGFSLSTLMPFVFFERIWFSLLQHNCYWNPGRIFRHGSHRILWIRQVPVEISWNPWRRIPIGILQTSERVGIIKIWRYSREFRLFPTSEEFLSESCVNDPIFSDKSL